VHDFACFLFSDPSCRTNSIAALRAKAQEHSAKLFAGLDPVEQAKLFAAQAGGHLGAHHVTSSANSSAPHLYHVTSSANDSGALHHAQAQSGLFSAVDHSTSVF
jgi:hypothetical protein